ncbi:MAG: ComEA family DNA-binding protein, partial [Synergistales bacterium]|nr:ComEA family DNA-binding protein [Synergistales bacterium]
VYQALDAAGGFSPEADQEAVNLAAMLQDGAHIKFPAKGEAAPVNKDVPPGTAQPVSRTEGMPGPNARVDLTNINTALKEELERLPGVGPKTAEKIIEYREKNGIYQRKEDLLLVKGIGPAKYDAVKNLVTVAQ